MGAPGPRPAPAGTAGVMVSLSRILTKLLLPDELASTLIFFLVSAGLELLCFLLHLAVRRSRFVLHHTVRPRGRRHAPGDVCFVRAPGPRVPPLRGGRRQAQPLPVPTELPLSGWPPSGRGLSLLPMGPPSLCGPGPHPLVARCGLGPTSKPSRCHHGELGALWWRQGCIAPRGPGLRLGRAGP